MWEKVIAAVVMVVVIVVNQMLGNKKLQQKVAVVDKKIGPALSGTVLAMEIVEELRESLSDYNITSEEATQLETKVRRLIGLAQSKGGVTS